CDTAAFFVDSLRYDHADPQLSILAPLAGTPIQTLHRKSLVLKDDVADMSYRGWQQTPEDHAMIAGHPEIFSSFYSTPLPHLEREFLKELRDFLLCGMRAFRRLLLGLHQDSGNVVDVFQQWQEWRGGKKVHFSYSGCTPYQRQRRLSGGLFQVVRPQYIPRASKAPLAITALVEYETALLDGDHESDGIRHNQEQVSDDISEELLSPDSRPQLLPGVSVVKLPADYREIVRRLQQRSPLNDIPDHPVKLAIRR